MKPKPGWKFRLTLSAVLATAQLTVVETRCLVWGRNARARVGEAYDGPIPDPDQVKAPVVRFVHLSFSDEDGGARTVVCTTEKGASINAGDEVNVQFVPGRDDSVRLANDGRSCPEFALPGALAVTAGLVKLCSHAPKRRRGRRANQAIENDVQVLEAT